MIRSLVALMHRSKEPLVRVESYSKVLAHGVGEPLRVPHLSFSSIGNGIRQRWYTEPPVLLVELLVVPEGHGCDGSVISNPVSTLNVSQYAVSVILNGENLNMFCPDSPPVIKHCQF